ncbi:MAG TPA: hypothetical protein VG412_11915 [Acidimicrobiales bacterium]|nr:hypothetical protein [Acidimicrobiales bacterium]
MIRSAKMKLMTPPKPIPPFQRTAASGTFPIEQTKEKIEITGPISGPEILAAATERLGDHLSSCVSEAIEVGGPDAQKKIAQATDAIARLVRS